MAAKLPTSLRRRFVWLALLVGVLIARGLTPDGWMPVANAAGGIKFTICTGMGPADTTMSMSMSMAHGKMHHKAPAKGRASDHPCAFAGIGLADNTRPPTTIAAPFFKPPSAAPAIERLVAAPGRGLAAPPPPATGPPTLI